MAYRRTVRMYKSEMERISFSPRRIQKRGRQVVPGVSSQFFCLLKSSCSFVIARLIHTAFFQTIICRTQPRWTYRSCSCLNTFTFAAEYPSRLCTQRPPHIVSLSQRFTALSFCTHHPPKTTLFAFHISVDRRTHCYVLRTTLQSPKPSIKLSRSHVTAPHPTRAVSYPGCTLAKDMHGG